MPAEAGGQVDRKTSEPASGVVAGSNSVQVRVTWALALIAAIAAAVVYTWIGDSPLGTHVDEAKKIRFVLTGEQDFFHPLLMIQLGRLSSEILGYTDVDRAFFLVRFLAALFGGFLVFATFVLGRMVLSPFAALAVAIAVAVCPTTTVHATFFKEDIFLAPLFVLSVAALVWTTKNPSLFHSMILGAAIGLTAATKYVGSVVFLLSIVFLLFAPNGTWTVRLRAVGTVAIVAIVLFSLINTPLFLELDVFSRGLARETNHAVTGHQGLALWPSVTGGSMHLRESLLPGLGLPLLVIGLLGLLAPLLYTGRRYPLLVILCFILTWYAVHEFSPMKPYGIERYMVPLIPLLLVLGAAFLELIAGRVDLKSGLLVPLVLLVAALPALHSSFRIMGSRTDDPRRVITAVAPLLGRGVRVLDSFSSFNRKALVSAATGGRPREPATIIVADLVVDRYLRYGTDSTMDRPSRETLSNIQLAFEEKEWPFLEISNERPGYSYLNPTIYVVAVDYSSSRLREIANAMEAYIESEDLDVSVEMFN